MVEFKEVAFGEREMTASIDDVHYDKEKERCNITGKPARSNQIHFILSPVLPEGWKKQNWWLYDTVAKGSSWYEVVKQFMRLKIITEDDVKSAESNMDIARKIVENSKGKYFKFVESRLGRALKKNWFPQEVVEL